MIKIAHIADTHWRNLERHEEYENVSKQFFNLLKEEKIDLVVHCGDIVHQKTNITPELVDKVSWFLRNIAEICPLVMILGNHDGIIKNKSRQDSITPIVKSLNLKNIYLFKKTQNFEFEIKNQKINFAIYSCFDKIERLPIDTDKLNIALYHGPINGSKTDLNFSLVDESYIGKDFFNGYDFVFLGDIHKRQILSESSIEELEIDEKDLNDSFFSNGWKVKK